MTIRNTNYHFRLERFDLNDLTIIGLNSIVQNKLLQHFRVYPLSKKTNILIVFKYTWIIDKRDERKYFMTWCHIQILAIFWTRGLFWDTDWLLRSSDYVTLKKLLLAPHSSWYDEAGIDLGPAKIATYCLLCDSFSKSFHTYTFLQFFHPVQVLQFLELSLGMSLVSKIKE